MFFYAKSSVRTIVKMRIIVYIYHHTGKDRYDDKYYQEIIMKYVRSIMLFLIVPIAMLGSVWASYMLHKADKNIVYVNTSPDESGIIRTVRVFGTVESVMVIDRSRHSHKMKIMPDKWSYDPLTTELTIAEPLPFAENVIHIEGTAVQPEQFCLHDFDASPDNLLVILDGHEAVRDYEYIYNEETHIITFRNDIHPETDGTFLIMYQSQNEAAHSFGNWLPGTDDRYAVIQGQWLARTMPDAPMMAMLDRSKLSNRRLSREVGFDIRLPGGDASFICQTIDGTQKHQTVMRWYGEIIAECQNEPFSDSADQSADELLILNIGRQNVTRQEIIGTRSNPDGSTEPLPMVIYHWTLRGTYYRISVEPEKASEAERIIGRM